MPLQPARHFTQQKTNQHFVLNGIKPTKEERLAIAKATEGQRTNPLWLKYKKRRVTASNFGSVLRAVNTNLFYPSLFKMLLGEYSSSERAASVQWGIDHESCATEVVREDCQARKLNKEDAVDSCKWRKVIKEVR